MQCAQCGTVNERGAAFCAGCGSPLAMEAPSPEPMPSAQPAVSEPVAAPPVMPVEPIAYAPAPAAAPAFAPTPPPPPRKKHGCLITTIALFSIVALVSAAAVWYVTRPPKDLGVSYTEADYQSAVQELGMEVVDTVPNLPIEETKIVYSGKQVRSIAKGNPVRLSSKQISAVVSMHHRSPKWAFADVQILLGDNDQAQMSGFAVYEGTRYAFYTDLNVLLAGPRTVGGTAEKIVVFGMDFPQQWYSVAEQYLIQKTNDWLAGMGEGLNITGASIDGGELLLEGTFPTSAKRVPLGAINTTGTPTP